jgi:hypothetical protein
LSRVTASSGGVKPSDALVPSSSAAIRSNAIVISLSGKLSIETYIGTESPSVAHETEEGLLTRLTVELTIIMRGGKTEYLAVSESPSSSFVISTSHNEA